MMHGSRNRGAWGVTTICKQNARTMVLEGIHTVFEGSLHSSKSPICKHNATTINLEGNHMLRRKQHGLFKQGLGF